MNAIQITTICISIAALVLNIVNTARTRKRCKEAEAKVEELKRQIANAEWDV